MTTTTKQLTTIEIKHFNLLINLPLHQLHTGDGQNNENTRQYMIKTELAALKEHLSTFHYAFVFFYVV